MSQFKRGETWSFVVDVPPGLDGKRRQVSKGGFRTKAEAKQAEADVLVLARKGPVPGKSTAQLGPYLDEWMDSVRPKLAPATIDSYRRAINTWIEPRIGRVRLQAITPDVLQAFYRDLGESGRLDGKGGLRSRSVRLAHQVLHLALGKAHRRGLILTNPAADPDLTLPAHDTKKMDVWSEEEARQFLVGNGVDPLWVLWALIVSTGLRRGEALGLRWHNVNLDRAYATISETWVVASGKGSVGEPKTGSSRRVVMLRPEVIDGLRALRDEQVIAKKEAGTAWQDTGYVFTTTIGTPLDPRNVLRFFKEACKRAKVRHIRIHDLRHTAATLAFESGTHPKAVSEMLGHSRTGITLDLYTHSSTAMQQDASEKIGGLLFGSGETDPPARQEGRGA